jgi:hypothetical protein
VKGTAEEKRSLEMQEKKTEKVMVKEKKHPSLLFASCLCGATTACVAHRVLGSNLLSFLVSAA